MNVRGHLGVLGRRWRIVVIALLICVGGSAALSMSATPSYQASASLFFSLQNGNTANELAQGSTFTQNQMASYATLATTATVLDRVIDELHLATGVSGLARQVDASTPSDTVILKISATSGSPAQAAAIANSVAENLTEAVDGLAPVNAQGDASVRSTVVAPAEAPQFQSSPKTRRNVVLGFLLGVVLGALLAMLREALDTRVRGAEEVAALTSLPVLGTLAVSDAERDGVLVVADAPLDPQAERYRQLRTNLQFSQAPGRALVVGVTSALPAEGKSTVSLNLALSLAEVSGRVLLVDADLRRPTIADRLGLEGAAGLSTVLIGRARVEDVVQEWGPRGLSILTSGIVPPNPTELLSSPAMTELVQDLAKRYDVVVFDTAPVLPVTDAQLLSRHVTAMVVVANTRALRRPQLSAALAALAQVDARVVGLVLNKVPARRSAEGYGYRAEEFAASSRRSAWWSGGRRRAPGPVPGATAGSAPVLRSRPGLPVEASRSGAPLGAPARPAARRPGDLVRAADE